MQKDRRTLGEAGQWRQVAYFIIKAVTEAKSTELIASPGIKVTIVRDCCTVVHAETDCVVTRSRIRRAIRGR